MGLKGCFLFVTFLDANAMLHIADDKIFEILSIKELIESLTI